MTSSRRVGAIGSNLKHTAEEHSARAGHGIVLFAPIPNGLGDLGGNASARC